MYVLKSIKANKMYKTIEQLFTFLSNIFKSEVEIGIDVLAEKYGFKIRFYEEYTVKYNIDTIHFNLYLKRDKDTFERHNSYSIGKEKEIVLWIEKEFKDWLKERIIFEKYNGKI